MNFSDTITAYKNSKRLFKDGAMGHPVLFPELAKFDVSRRQFALKLKENALHDSWEEGLKIFNTIHAKLARTPCRPNWLIHEILDIQGGKDTLCNLRARLQFVDPDVRNVFDALNSQLDALSRLECSPLLEHLTRIFPSGEKTGSSLFILRDLRLWEEARRCLTNVLPAHDWEISKPSSLRNQQHADRLFLFGPVWCLRYRHEEYLLRAPASGQIHIVACAHEFTGDVSLSLLHESTNIKINGRRNLQPNEKPWDFEPIAQAQIGRFRLKGSGESKIWESGKKVKAVPFRLGGARGTYFATDSSVWVVTADFSGSSPVCTGVDKIPVDDLEPGGLILMTTSGGGDMIPLVADMILHHSRPIRELQLAWKTALLARIQTDGLDNTSLSLRALGAQMASPTNLKNWCNPRSIGMENLDTDLSAVLKLIGKEACYSDVLAGIEALRGAHQSAGRQLQAKLLKSLKGRDLSEVFRQGELEIRHGDGPAKTVFLVEERGQEDEIPEDWEGELRDIDE
jgi:hypothetical protein